ncbi:MAG: Crp/Fnr family transcriptional regulator [Sphingomonadaceae bacterium]
MVLECETCPVKDRAACSVLSDAERADLAKHGRTVMLNRGDLLFEAGADNNSCATLVSGALKVTSLDAEGNESILALVHPAGFVGEMFTPFAHHEVSAVAPSKVCIFTRSDLEAVVESHPKLGIALLRRTQEELHDARDLLDFSRRKSARARLAAFLIATARAASDSPCHPAGVFELPISRGEIGSMLGLTIETVSRQLGNLEDLSAIRRTGKRGIELVDPALLGELAA